MRVRVREVERGSGRDTQTTQRDAQVRANEAEGVLMRSSRQSAALYPWSWGEGAMEKAFFPPLAIPRETFSLSDDDDDDARKTQHLSIYMLSPEKSCAKELCVGSGRPLVHAMQTV